jgi:carbamoyl-phosphate synthase large subunit
MHGCGNDYVYVNCLGGEIDYSLAKNRAIDSHEALAKFISDRHFGVGGDGLVLVCRSEFAPARMRMFNADGSEGKMCGNAIRCVAKFLYDDGFCAKKNMKIETMSGVKTLEFNIQNNSVTSARVNMGKPELAPEKIPAKLLGENIVSREIMVGGKPEKITCVSMGNPHAVIFCEDVDSLNLPEIGPLFENHEIFPERVNAEFVQIIDKNTIKMRVWERGSGETLACGPGSCAAVIACVLNGYAKIGEDIAVILHGGELRVNYTGRDVYMTGPCEMVFSGEIEI